MKKRNYEKVLRKAEKIESKIQKIIYIYENSDEYEPEIVKKIVEEAGLKKEYEEEEEEWEKIVEKAVEILKKNK